MSRPLVIDLYAGLGGWADGLLAEGWDVIGFDIKRHQYGEHRYPAQLVIHDVLTLHGSQFRDADLIVASPPCQQYSYMAMPWTRAKAKAAAIRADTTGKMLADLNRLFEACFRIQAQASLAAGWHIPMVVENVRGAQPWVGRARWNFGSFYLWGDVPALMPPIGRYKSSGMNWSDRSIRGQDFTRIAGQQALGIKGVPHRTDGHWTNPGERAIKLARQWWTDGSDALSTKTSSHSPARKAASAMIAKIPLPLARYIGAVYRPNGGIAAVEGDGPPAACTLPASRPSGASHLPSPTGSLAT